MENEVRKSSARFEPSDYLDSEEVIAEYLSAAAEDPDPNVFVAAQSDVRKARSGSA